MAYNKIDMEEVLHFFPQFSRNYIKEIFETHSFHFFATQPRLTRLGCFKSGTKNVLPAIYMNKDLKPHFFFFVFLHEFAHFKVYKNYAKQVKPHGREWKTEYEKLTAPFLCPEILPEKLIVELRNFFDLPCATFNNNIELLDQLSQLDGESKTVRLKDLSENDMFVMPNGKHFVKKETKRTRCRCFCSDDKKYYWVTLSAQINDK